MARYCSVLCYQLHGEACTESFYRFYTMAMLETQMLIVSDVLCFTIVCSLNGTKLHFTSRSSCLHFRICYRNNAASAMKGTFSGDNERRSMQNILKRLHALDLEEKAGPSNDFTSPRNSGAGSTDAVLRLSPAALQMISDMETSGRFDFHALPVGDQRELKSLFASTCPENVEPWQPWWHDPSVSMIRLTQHGQCLISPVIAQDLSEEDCDSANESDRASFASHPSPPSQPLPQLSSLSTAQPHPQLYMTLLQSLYAYCTAMYLYNGDPHDDLEGYIGLLWHVAPGLHQVTTSTTLPDNLSVAIRESMKNLQNTDDDWTCIAGTQFCRWAWTSVAMICAGGRGAAVCAMADVQRQHQAVLAQTCPKQGPISKKTLKWCLHKLQFLLSFANSCSEEQYSSWSNKVNYHIQEKHPSRPVSCSLLKTSLVGDLNR